MVSRLFQFRRGCRVLLLERCPVGYAVTCFELVWNSGGFLCFFFVLFLLSRSPGHPGFLNTPTRGECYFADSEAVASEHGGSGEGEGAVFLQAKACVSPLLSSFNALTA